jgi:hypothetical protein
VLDPGAAPALAPEEEPPPAAPPKIPGLPAVGLAILAALLLLGSRTRSPPADGHGVSGP